MRYPCVPGRESWRSVATASGRLCRGPWRGLLQVAESLGIGLGVAPRHFTLTPALTFKGEGERDAPGGAGVGVHPVSSLDTL